MHLNVTHRESWLYPGVKRKRGVGTVIGAAFVVLIIFTWYTYFQLSLNDQREYSEALRTMQDIANKQRAENLEILSVSTTSQDKINITVRNNGENQAHLIYLGIHDEVAGSHDYYRIDIYFNPAETLTDVRNESITIPSGGEREIQLITGLGNVYSFSYPYTPSSGTGDGGSDLSSVTIIGIGLPHNPSNWDLIGSTTNVSGSVSDLVDDDGNYMVFRSYPSGNSIDIQDFVDNNSSDMDGSADKGSHGNFPAQQSGPNSVSDTLTEEVSVSVSNTTLISQESFELGPSWPPSGWSETGRWNREGNQVYDGTRSADFDGGGGGRSGNLDSLTMDTSDADAIYVDFWYRDELCDNGELLLQYYDGNNWDTIADLSSTTSEYQWLNYEEKITDPQYFKSNFEIRWSAVSIDNGEHFYVDLVNVMKEAIGQNYELDLEIQWTNVNYSKSNEELAIYVGGPPANTHSLDATGGYMIVGDGSPDWGPTVGTISFWAKWDTVANRPWGQHQDMEFRITGSNLVLDWGGTTSLTSSTTFVAGTWYFIAVVWNENSNDLYLYVGDENNAPTLDTSDLGWGGSVSTLGVTENNFMASGGGNGPIDGHGDELRYWNTDRSLPEIQSDYNTELTGSEANLRSYFKLNNNFDDIGPNNDDGSGSGSSSFSFDVPFSGSMEGLNVDVWYGGSWQNLFVNLSAGWNNASVSSYLDSSTFTIRYKGATETGDSTQDTWEIDAALLHLWTDSNRYTAEVEFTGTSNLEAWTEVEWHVSSSWDLGAISVTVQFYNFTLGDYASNGDGFFSYVSDATPDTDELINQTISSSPTDFRNASGHWRIRVIGEKSAGTEFQMRVDWIVIKPIYPSAGNIIDYNVWREYRVKAYTSQGDPISYGIVSMYGNGTSLSFRDAVSKNPISNPDWVYLNIEGMYHLELRASFGSSETFYLRTVVGSILGEKTIIQQSP